MFWQFDGNFGNLLQFYYGQIPQQTQETERNMVEIRGVKVLQLPLFLEKTGEKLVTTFSERESRLSVLSLYLLCNL